MECVISSLLRLVVAFIYNVFVKIAVHIIRILSRAHNGFPSVIIKSVCWYFVYVAKYPLLVANRQPYWYDKVQLLNTVNLELQLSKHHYKNQNICPLGSGEVINSAEPWLLFFGRCNSLHTKSYCGWYQSSNSTHLGFKLRFLYNQIIFG
jgi:hypothetical protein